MPLVFRSQAKSQSNVITGSSNDEIPHKKAKVDDGDQSKGKFIPKYVHYKVTYHPSVVTDSANNRIQKFNDLVKLAELLERYSLGQLPTKGKRGTRIDHTKLLLTDVVTITVHAGVHLYSTPEERENYQNTTIPELNLICKQYNKNKQSGFCLIMKKWEKENVEGKYFFDFKYTGKVADPRNLSNIYLDGNALFMYTSFPENHPGGQRELEVNSMGLGPQVDNSMEEDEKSHCSEEIEDVDINTQGTETIVVPDGSSVTKIQLEGEDDGDSLKDVDKREMEKEYVNVLEDAAKYNPIPAAVLCYIHKLEKDILELQQLVQTTHISNVDEINKLMTRDGALVAMSEDLYLIGTEERLLADYERNFGNNVLTLAKQRTKVANKYMEYARKMKQS